MKLYLKRRVRTLFSNGWAFGMLTSRLEDSACAEFWARRHSLYWHRTEYRTSAQKRWKSYLWKCFSQNAYFFWMVCLELPPKTKRNTTVKKKEKRTAGSQALRWNRMVSNVGGRKFAKIRLPLSCRILFSCTCFVLKNASMTSILSKNQWKIIVNIWNFGQKIIYFAKPVSFEKLEWSGYFGSGVNTSTTLQLSAHIMWD